MKKVYLLIIAITLCVCIFSQNNKQGEGQNERRLKILNRVVNLGDIKDDTIITARFYFVNVGTKGVTIYSVNPDCTCTGYFVSKEVVSPSDTVYVELKFDTKDKGGPYKLCAVMETDTYAKMYKFTMIVNIVGKDETAL
jgi:hypothetical protein